LHTEIRPANPEDNKTLKTISRRVIDKNYRPFLGDEGVDWFINGPSDDYVEEHLDRTDVIVLDGVVIGYSVCKDNLIDLMMIDHDQHCRGYGAILLKHCEQKLFKQYGEISLESFEGNVKANNFYCKNQWTEVKRYLDEGNTGYRKILFKKERE